MKGSAPAFDTIGLPAPLDRAELGVALANGPRVSALDLLDAEDAYYYGHKEAVALPVWRARLDDTQQTRLYLDPVTGQLIRAVDANGRAYRRLMHGLHSLDLPGLRLRPIWDLVVLPLLVMVTLVCATGTWMGVSKARRDFRRIRNRRRRIRAARLQEALT
jgi:heme exporter protein D